MRKIIYLAVIISLFYISLNWANAQQAGRIHRIGYLVPRSTLEPRDQAFLQGLRDLGYIEEKNIIIEYRLGNREQLPKFAAELVGLNVDVIIAPGSPPALAAKAATRTIPIIFSVVADPVGIGLVNSLARPGGNITGLTPLSAELSAKRLELLKEIIPKLSRIGVLSTPDYPHAIKLAEFKELEDTGRALGLQLQFIEVQGRNGLERAFKAMKQERTEAFTVLTIPFFLRERKRIIELASKNQLPAIFHWKQYAEDGGLVSYGPDGVALYRRSAKYVDKILKGAKPADLPVEQARDFELVINLKTASRLGLTIPPEILYRADMIIK